MFGHKPTSTRVSMTTEEYQFRLAHAYHSGWEDARLDTPFFNGYYISKKFVGVLSDTLSCRVPIGRTE